jgi:hypothetical protein
MTAVIVAFAGTWLTDPTDPSVSLQVFKTDRVELDSVAATVRTYAGGRRRIITTPGDDRSSALTFQRASVADVEQLRAWRGRLLLLRDFQGWRRWGMYADIAPVSINRGPGHDPIYAVSLTWVDVDYDEAV